MEVAVEAIRVVVVARRDHDDPPKPGAKPLRKRHDVGWRRRFSDDRATLRREASTALSLQIQREIPVGLFSATGLCSIPSATESPSPLPPAPMSPGRTTQPRPHRPRTRTAQAQQPNTSLPRHSTSSIAPEDRISSPLLGVLTGPAGADGLSRLGDPVMSPWPRSLHPP